MIRRLNLLDGDQPIQNKTGTPVNVSPGGVTAFYSQAPVSALNPTRTVTPNRKPETSA
jgi:hypothetical protein